MHSSYKTLLKGRSNPDEILQKLSLPLDEQPNEQQTALVKQCLAKLDENIPLDEAVKQSLEWAASQSAIATKERPMPALAVQDAAIASSSRAVTHQESAGIPDDLQGKMTELWDETLNQRIEQDATAIAGAPFNAIDDASREISPKALYDTYRGAYFHGIKERLDSKELLEYAKDRAKGKK